MTPPSSNSRRSIAVIHTHSTHGRRTRRSNRSTRRRGGRGQHTPHSPAPESEEHDDTDEPAGLEALPLPLFHHIMSFALSCPQKSVRHPRTAAEQELDEIGLVSKAIRVHATEIQGQLALGMMLVWVYTGTRKEMLAFRREVLYRRQYVRELEVNVFPPTTKNAFDANEWLGHVLAQVATIVSLMPQLEVLNLGACCGDVSGIVQAATQNCMQLHSLILPMDRMDDQRGRAGQSIDMQPTIHALYHGLPQWHKRTGGLRQVRIPSRPTTNHFTTSMEFVDQIVSYCPKIELLDAALSQWSLDESLDEWVIDRAMWTRFCETCTNLREFDWVTVPWATDFFEIFARFPKKQLINLGLKTTMQWDWEAYFEHVGPAEASTMKINGFGSSANRVHLVLQACPALKHLSIIANSRVSNDDETLDTMLDLEEYDGRQAPLPFKQQNAMNQGLFSDNFCHALVQHCPLLEEFRLTEDHEALALSMKRVRPIMRFQDAAMESLAQLQHLSVVDLKAVNISGKGLFALVNSSASETHGTRCYDLSIGDEQTKSKKFYKAMQEFLQYMLHSNEKLLIPSKRIYLCVINGNTSSVETRWSESFLGRLKGAIRALKRKYPTITFRVETDGLTNTTFTTIYGFGLYTETATQPLDSRWIDLPPEALEEDVFIMEEIMDDLHEDDEDDDDHRFDDDFNDEEDRWVDDDEEDDEEFDSDDPGHRRRTTFFNGVDFPDIGALSLHGHLEEDEYYHDDYTDHAFDDQDGYDY